MAGQGIEVVAAEGYISAVHPPNAFDVSECRVTISPSTRMGATEETSDGKALPSSIQVGAYVYVWAVYGCKGSITAGTLHFRDEAHNKLAGMGVIDRLISDGWWPVFQADGYRIRITSGTKLAFKGGLQTIADIGPNVWIRYEGKRNAAGELVASKAEFLPARATEFKALKGFEVPVVALKSDDPNRNPGGVPIRLDDPGALQPNDKVRWGVLLHWHTILDDPAIQARVRRVGMSVVPQYQRDMPIDNPSKIPFNFYVIDDDKDRTALCPLDGLVLMPKAAMDRLENDDELAAVLADAVAISLQRQRARVVADKRSLLALYEAGAVASAFVPGLGLATSVAGGSRAEKADIELDEQRGRVALALMADAGYDPWQAPQAWRRLGPKDLPADLTTLAYTSHGGYQVGILKLQYRKTPPAAHADAAAPESGKTKK